MEERIKKPRGVAAAAAGLSKPQIKILIWIHRASLKGLASKGAEQNAEKISFRKIPWSAKKFYDEAPTRAQESSLSTSLGRLAERGLVALYDATDGNGVKPRTTHVKMTKAGEKVASMGMTKRQYVIRDEIAELRKFKHSCVEARMLQHEIRPSVDILPVVSKILGLKKSIPTESGLHREEVLKDFDLWVIFDEVYRGLARAIRKRAKKVGDDLEPDEVADSEMLTDKHIEATFPTDPIDPEITILY